MPERIEAIHDLRDAERYLRAEGWSRTRSRAFVARIRDVAAMKHIADTLRRAQALLLKD